MEYEKTILNYPKFLKKIGVYIKVQTYDRDGGHKHPRHRIELRGAPPKITEEALAFEMPCVTCGRTISPFRLCKGNKNGFIESRRSSTAGVYFAATCPLNTSIGCSRSKQAAEEYERVVKKYLG